MTKKNYIENVTNLERMYVKYVPRTVFDGLWYKTINLLDKLDEDDKEAIDEIEKIKTLAEASTVTQPLIPDEPEEVKKDLDICPYCGSKMVISYDEHRNRYNNYGYHDQKDLAYRCPNCGAKSPWVFLTIDLINEEKFRSKVERTISDIVEDREYEDKEEEE